MFSAAALGCQVQAVCNLAGIRKELDESMQMKSNHTIVINNNSCTGEAICTDTRSGDEERNLYQYWWQHSCTSVGPAQLPCW